jgi:hypothetical protein
MKRLVALVLAFVLGAPLAFAQPKPALVRDFDGPTRDPVQFRGTISVCQTVYICFANYDALTVPTGKRLIITQVYVRINAQNPGPGGTRVTLGSSVPSASVGFTVMSGSVTDFSQTQPLTYYVDAGANPQIQFFANDNRGNWDADVTLTGYWVTVP